MNINTVWKKLLRPFVMNPKLGVFKVSVISRKEPFRQCNHKLKYDHQAL